MGKIGGLEWDNVINMIEARLHVSRTHSSLPKNATVICPLLLVDTSPWSSISDRDHPPDNTPQEVHWVGKAQAPLDSFQDA
jgi:hypothetical protein